MFLILLSLPLDPLAQYLVCNRNEDVSMGFLEHPQVFVVRIPSISTRIPNKTNLFQHVNSLACELRMFAPDKQNVLLPLKFLLEHDSTRVEFMASSLVTLEEKKAAKDCIVRLKVTKSEVCDNYHLRDSPATSLV